jgi:hypothetical protein
MTRRQRIPLIITLLMVIIIGITITAIYTPGGGVLQFWAFLAGIGVALWLAHRSLED